MLAAGIIPVKRQTLKTANTIHAEIWCGVLHTHVLDVMCNEVYIGQTGRPLPSRLKKHKAAVKFAKTDVSAAA